MPGIDEVIGLFVSDMGDLSTEDTGRLRSRLKHFVADDDSGEAVSVKFDEDPDDQTHVLPGATDFNGLIRHDLEIPRQESPRASGRAAVNLRVAILILHGLRRRRRGQGPRTPDRAAGPVNRLRHADRLREESQSGSAQGVGLRRRRL